MHRLVRGRPVRHRRRPHRNWTKASTALGVLALTLTLSGRAHAQTGGFALDRFDPSERGSDWFSADSLDLRGNRRWSAGLVGDYAFKPLVIYDADGSEQTAVVSHQFFAHLGGTFTLVDRVRFGVNLPIAFYQAGSGGDAQGGTYQSTNDNTLGDLRVSADARVFGTYRDPATIALGLALFAPTGSREAFTGDGAVRFVPRAAIAGDVGKFTYAGGLDLVIRTQSDDFAGAGMGSEIGLRAALGARLLDDQLTVGPELTLGTVFSNADGFFAQRTTPVEMLAGAHYTVANGWRIGGGIGPGLSRALGTPALRVVLAIEWVEPFAARPRPEARRPELIAPHDRDFDSILDADDACPYVYGVKSADPKTNGCPPTVDTDGDGIDDPTDACPEIPGTKTDDPKTNGCPADRDNDGVLDAADACPDEAGPKTEDPKTNGCPPPKDADGDGILDADDACPKDAGPRNEDRSKNGCPLARVENEQIKISEQVQFATDSAKLLPTSDVVLVAVLQILQQHTEITHVSIEGHTDDKGTPAHNKRLSQDRANSVMKWFVAHGIEKSHLDAKGFGMDRPLDTNGTEEGRAGTAVWSSTSSARSLPKRPARRPRRRHLEQRPRRHHRRRSPIRTRTPSRPLRLRQRLRHEPRPLAQSSHPASASRDQPTRSSRLTERRPVCKDRAPTRVIGAPRRPGH